MLNPYESPQSASNATPAEQSDAFLRSAVRVLCFSDDDALIQRFVATFERLDDLTAFHDAPPPERAFGSAVIVAGNSLNQVFSCQHLLLQLAHTPQTSRLLLLRRSVSRKDAPK